jgi:hypothetical protein
MTRPGLGALTVGWLVALSVLLRAADVTVTPLLSDGHLFVSLAAPSAYSSEAREVVKSSLPVTISYVVDLKRPVPMWFDRTLESVTLVASVSLDALTGTYHVSKQRDDKVIWSDRTDQEDQVRAWVTAFDRVALDAHEALEPNGEYYVQVHVHSSAHRSNPLWPFGHDEESGRGEFTFIR